MSLFGDANLATTTTPTPNSDDDDDNTAAHANFSVDMHYVDVLLLFAWVAILTTRIHVPGAIYYYFNSMLGKENGQLCEEIQKFGFPPFWRARTASDDNNNNSPRDYVIHTLEEDDEKSQNHQEEEEEEGADDDKKKKNQRRRRRRHHPDDVKTMEDSIQEKVFLPWRRVTQDMDANRMLGATPGVGVYWQLGAYAVVTLLTISAFLVSRDAFLTTGRLEARMVEQAVVLMLYVGVREAYGIIREQLIPNRAGIQECERDTIMLLLVKLGGDVLLALYAVLARTNAGAFTLAFTAVTFNVIWHIFQYTRYYF